jgi:cysteine desulfurase
MERIYLDYNATALPRPEVIELVAAVMADGGNPSSVHGRGRKARARVEEARSQVAALVNALPPEVVFTGSGTEATDLAMNGVAPANGITDLVVSAIEHPASRGAAGQSPLPVTELPVTREGVIDAAAAEKIFDDLATEGRKAMVVVMRANNETGILQPVSEIAQMVRDRDLGLVHCDAVQAAGKIPVDVVMLGADTMSIAAHKFGGPQGVGALIVREGVTIAPRLSGGGQEQGRRSGTENVAGIAGFGLAAELALEHLSDFAALGAHRDRLEAGLRETSNAAVVFGDGQERLPNTSCFAVPGVPAETALMMLDLGGIEVSSGSACSSGKVANNHVLAAMGVDDTLRMGALRVSLGWNSQPDHVDRFLEVWRGQVMQMCQQTEAAQ